MSDDVFLDEPQSWHKQPAARWLSTVVICIGLFAGGCWTIYQQFRIDVPTGSMAILIKKTGLDLQNGDEIAPSSEYRGVQREYLSEGRYFRNPFLWDWEVIPQKVINPGQVGVLVSLAGDDLPYGEFLARLDETTNPTTKGIVPGVLRPGRYPIHPYLFKVEEGKPIDVPAGFKGVVTHLAGPLPEIPNTMLVPEGTRGVQEKAFDPGTYYINPFETRISLVDCRSQRFNLAKNKDMGFPSKDGFWVSLDGIIEFRVKPDRAADVFVTYNEDFNGELIDEEIIQKVILPNARSFCRLEGSNELGREFIEGATRTQFQENFQTAMRNTCEPLGIEIIQALITKIRPPQKIAKPVREREIAKQMEKQYQQEILQQESEKNLAIQTELVQQRQAIVQADQQVVKVVTEAKREQEVDLTEAQQRLGVAKFRLDAAEDKAEAILAHGKADAAVVQFGNEAEAAGWREAVGAFSGHGEQYARYVLLQKMAAAYREIMVNTADSPIMRIFETFASPGPSMPVHSTVPPTAEAKSVPLLKAENVSTGGDSNVKAER
jgi:hypothetical protein